MKNVLVPIDFSDVTDDLIATARTLGEAFGSVLRLLHVAPADPSIAHSKSWPQEVRDEFAKELQTEHRQLQGYAEDLEAAGLHAKAILTRGNVVDVILEVAQKTDTDLIVLGSHPKGAFAELLPHSIVRSVARKAQCKVMIVPRLAPEGKAKEAPPKATS